MGLCVCAWLEFGVRLCSCCIGPRPYVGVGGEDCFLALLFEAGSLPSLELISLTWSATQRAPGVHLLLPDTSVHSRFHGCCSSCLCLRVKVDRAGFSEVSVV